MSEKLKSETIVEDLDFVGLVKRMFAQMSSIEQKLNQVLFMMQSTTEEVDDEMELT